MLVILLVDEAIFGYERLPNNDFGLEHLYNARFNIGEKLLKMS